MKVRVKKAHADAVIPKYQTEGAAGFDIHAVEDGHLFPLQVKKVCTGLAFEIPENHVLLIFPRSGLAFRGLELTNKVAVIDSDYRGEVKLPLTLRADSEALYWQKGDRLAQGVVVPYVQVAFEEADELTDTARGAGGFGSTGVRA